MIIDSHLHVWNRARASYPWLGPHLPEVDRDIDIDEVGADLSRLGVDAVVLVQSSDNAEDTANMLEVARTDRRVWGVVAWAPIEDAAQARERLSELTRDARVVGIRNLIHDREDPDWVLRPGFGEGLSVLEEFGLPFDFVTADPHALSRLERIAARHPAVPFVLDHLAKPPINGTEDAFAAWASALQEVAALPNVVAKVSGLYSAVGPEDSWTPDGVRRVVDRAVELFGPQRLMYGGDWPMSLRAGGYERVITALRHAVADWPDSDLQDFWWRTAIRTYGLRGDASDEKRE